MNMDFSNLADRIIKQEEWNQKDLKLDKNKQPILTERKGQLTKNEHNNIVNQITESFGNLKTAKEILLKLGNDNDKVQNLENNLRSLKATVLDPEQVRNLDICLETIALANASLQKQGKQNVQQKTAVKEEKKADTVKQQQPVKQEQKQPAAQPLKPSEVKTLSQQKQDQFFNVKGLAAQQEPSKPKPPPQSTKPSVRDAAERKQGKEDVEQVIIKPFVPPVVKPLNPVQQAKVNLNLKEKFTNVKINPKQTEGGVPSPQPLKVAMPKIFQQASQQTEEKKEISEKPVGPPPRPARPPGSPVAIKQQEGQPARPKPPPTTGPDAETKKSLKELEDLLKVIKTPLTTIKSIEDDLETAKKSLSEVQQWDWANFTTQKKRIDGKMKTLAEMKNLGSEEDFNTFKSQSIRVLENYIHDLEKTLNKRLKNDLEDELANTISNKTYVEARLTEAKDWTWDNMDDKESLRLETEDDFNKFKEKNIEELSDYLKNLDKKKNELTEKINKINAQ